MRVQMFGGFCLTLEDKLVLSEGNRSSKALALLQCILLSREGGVPRDKLIDRLYGSEETDHVGNALKILIHRARKLLREAGLEAEDCLLYEKGIYKWNGKVAYELDVEEFERALREASDSLRGSGERIALYQRAEELYKGDFLPKCVAVEWASVLNVQYQGKYFACVRALDALLSEVGAYASLQAVLDRAIRYLPFEEEVHMMRIQCLMRQKRFHQASEAFNEVYELFLSELGIEPSEEMKLLYKEVAKACQHSGIDLPELIHILKEPEAKRGAYYCSFLTFIEFYRITLRSSARNGISSFLIYITIAGKSGAQLGEKVSEAAIGLQIAIQKSLRLGDVYTQNGSNQFLLLLMGISQENCQIVFGRIKKAFQECYSGKSIQLQQRIAPVSDVEQESSLLRFSGTFAGE